MERAQKRTRQQRTPGQEPLQATVAIEDMHQFRRMPTGFRQQTPFGKPVLILKGSRITLAAFANPPTPARDSVPKNPQALESPHLLSPNGQRQTGGSATLRLVGPASGQRHDTKIID